MATGNNPLQLLREFIINNKEIEFLDKDGNLTTKIEEAEQIKFGDAGTFDKNELTNYYFSKKAADRYSLISMLYFWKNRNEGYYTYLKATQLNKIQGVSFTFKTDLIDYLSGKKETSDNLKDQKEIEQLENSLDVENEDLDEGRLGSKRSNEEEEELTQMCKQIAKRERVLGGRNSILTSNKSFEHVIKISEEMLKKALEGGKEEKNGAKSVVHKGGVKSAVESGNTTRVAGHRKDTRDKTLKESDELVIIIPSAATSIVNMYNIEELLKGHKFSDNKIAISSGKEKPRKIIIEQEISGRKRKVKIVDSINGFTAEDWDKVVCVLTNGAAWQFTNWIWGAPQQIFERVFGVYPKFSDEKVRDTAVGWNLYVMNIERSKRHIDRATVMSFWEQLEKFINKRKA